MAGANGLTLTTTMSIRPIPCAAQLLELGGDVAAGQDPGVDRVVEGLDLAADVRLALRQRSETDVTSTPSAARYSRVPSVAYDLDVEIEQVARERDDAIPIRHRQQGSHPGVPPDPVVLRTVSGVGRGRPRTVATAPHQSRPSIPPDMAYSGRRSTREPEVRRVTLAPWEYLFTAFNHDNFPDIFHPTWIASLVLLVVLDDPLQRPDAGPPSPPAVPRHVGVAVVGRADHVQPVDHRIAVRVRLLPGPRRRRSSGSATLVWIRFVRFPPFLAAYETRLARERYFTKQKFADPEATIKKRPRPPPASGSAAGAGGGLRVPIEIRRFGVGHRRPDGPPGSIGLTGQVIHSDGRGTVSELAFARNARIEPHSNPNTTYLIVVEGGGWVGVGEEWTRIAAGEAAVWPADIPHAAWTEHSEMRAFVVEFAGPTTATRSWRAAG